MQIAKYVGHRPRPPSSGGVPLFPSFFLSLLHFFSRGGVAAGSQIPRAGSQAMSRAAMRFPDTAKRGGFSNSFGAAMPNRWMVRANRGGL